MSIEKFLINKNIAKDKKGAQKIMIGIIALCVLFFIVKGLAGNDRASEVELTEEEFELLEQEATLEAELDLESSL